MNYPTRRQAEDMLEWGVSRNPGPWRQHSVNAARAAETIAAKCGMDADRAYVLGLLHDIGRFEGVRGLHHAIAGYELMMRHGWDGVARICLNHSFPEPDSTTFNGKRDCTPDELAMLDAALVAMTYDDFDCLIQLCDALASVDGIGMIEPRLLNVAIRHGVGARYQQKWQGFLDIKRHFDEKCGCNIYSLFRDEIEKAIFD